MKRLRDRSVFGGSRGKNQVPEILDRIAQAGDRRIRCEIGDQSSHCGLVNTVLEGAVAEKINGIGGFQILLWFF